MSAYLTVMSTFVASLLNTSCVIGHMPADEFSNEPIEGIGSTVVHPVSDARSLPSQTIDRTGNVQDDTDAGFASANVQAQRKIKRASSLHCVRPGYPFV